MGLVCLGFFFHGEDFDSNAVILGGSYVFLWKDINIQMHYFKCTPQSEEFSASVVICVHGF